jgi:GNAT superfamily N-acetyltransferase
MSPDEYWSRFLGVSLGDLQGLGIRVVPHAALGDYWGLWIFNSRSSVIISTPQSLVSEVEIRLSALPSGCSDGNTDILSVLSPLIGSMIGPAYHGALQPEAFCPSREYRAVEISFDTAMGLSETGDPEGWEHSDSVPEKRFFGAFVDDGLAAIATYRSQQGMIDSPGMYTHPDFRGRGLGKATLSACLEHGLQAGLVLSDFQTLCTNRGAIRAAESLGIREYARHTAIRLKSEADS